MYVAGEFETENGQAIKIQWGKIIGEHMKSR